MRACAAPILLDMQATVTFFVLALSVGLCVAGVLLRRPRLRRRHTRPAVPGGQRRDFFGDGLAGLDELRAAAPRPEPAEEPAPAAAPAAPPGAVRRVA